MKFNLMLTIATGADNTRGDALVVFEGDGLNDPKVQLHLCISGHIGDVPWTAVIARACSHSSFKGCPRCFQLGTTCNSLGEALGCVRFLGYHEDTLVQKLEVNADVPPADPDYIHWVDSTICYATVVDGTAVFNQAAADQNRVRNEQHKLRARGATKLMHDKIRLRPMRDRRHGEALEAWEARTFMHHLDSTCGYARC
jgi:hypothetical protein